MTYKNKYPDSPKGQVFTAFSTKGEHAARTLAEKLQIAAARVNKWMAEWSAVEDSGRPEPKLDDTKAEIAAADKAQRQRKQTRPAPAAGKERVFDVGDPNVHGTVIERGEAVSGVKWDVDSPWGKTSYVSNEKLRPVEDEPSDRDRHTARHAKVFRVMRRDTLLESFDTFRKAAKWAGDDGNLWVFAVSSGGAIALLQRPHWPFYEKICNAAENRKAG